MHEEEIFGKILQEERKTIDTRLSKILKQSLHEFTEKTLNEIKDGERIIGRHGNKNKVNIKKETLKQALNKICPNNVEFLIQDFQKHYEEIRNFLPFCSSPKSFHTAWDLRSTDLDPYDADIIVNEGGQLIPINKSSRIFQCIQQGVELGSNQRFISAVRHVEGNYEDKLDDLGRFTYQPPSDTTGMLRYRWCQYLSKTLGTPYIVLVIIWFKKDISENLNHIFIIAPAKIINFEEDVKNLNNSIQKPLEFQLISRSEAYSSLNLLSALNESDLEIEARFELSPSLAREWTYDKINSTEKGRKIKKWAQKTGKCCPCISCRHTEFKDLKLNQIAFGHIISQKWSKGFTYILDKVNHPDNLYLTCQSCNSSLSDNFPSKELRDEILNCGTIGDWLRKSSDEIRSFEL